MAGTAFQQTFKTLPCTPLPEAQEFGDPQACQLRGNSPSERELLRVLWENPGRFLVRKEIHRRLNLPNRPTLGRIGQILAELFAAGFLDRIHGRSQGAQKAGFYTLSAKGQVLCRQLGFDRPAGTALFPTTPKMLATYLTSERLLRKSEHPSRITAFHSYHAGIGQSTAVAHVTRFIASRQKSFHNRLLVVDLDLATPTLDQFFRNHTISSCRGIRGLVSDFYQLQGNQRATWLRKALLQPEYVLHPSPNLFFLPTGFSPTCCPSHIEEWNESLTLLFREATSGFSRDQSTRCFLHEFKLALLDVYQRTILDTGSGASLGAWIGTQILADGLVAFVRLSDSEAHGTRAILANFLLRGDESGNEVSRIAFSFAPSRFSPDPRRIRSWIETVLLNAADRSQESTVRYPVAVPKYSAILAENREIWDLAEDVYSQLLDCLDLNPEVDARPPRPSIPLSLRLLLEEVGTNLRQQASDRRNILKGALASSLAPRIHNSDFDIKALDGFLDADVIDLLSETAATLSDPTIRYFQ